MTRQEKGDLLIQVNA